MFENMLVCLDGSILAEQILPYAEVQALKFNSRVTLLQVVVTNVPEVVQAGATYKQSTGAELRSREMMEKASIYLDKTAQVLREKGIRVETVVLEAASIGDAILKYVRDNGTDFILMATHGRGGIRHVVMGSIAEQVMKASALPILIIRPKNQ
jgi:nucleotide-binding universal stress UspA family protein